MFVALIPMQDVRLFELLMALAVKFLFEKILRKACTGLLVLDEVKKLCQKLFSTSLWASLARRISSIALLL